MRTIPDGPTPSPLSVSDVCLILEAGAKNGVRELNFSGLHVTFNQSVGPEPAMAHGNPFPASPPSDLTVEQHTTLAETALEKEEILAREDQLAERYEQMLQNGDLTDELPAEYDGSGLDDDGELQADE